MSSEWCYLDVNAGGKAIDTGPLMIRLLFRVLSVCVHKWLTWLQHPLIFQNDGKVK